MRKKAEPTGSLREDATVAFGAFLLIGFLVLGGWIGSLVTPQPRTPAHPPDAFFHPPPDPPANYGQLIGLIAGGLTWLVVFGTIAYLTTPRPTPFEDDEDPPNGPEAPSTEVDGASV